MCSHLLVMLDFACVRSTRKLMEKLLKSIPLRCFDLIYAYAFVFKVKNFLSKIYDIVIISVYKHNYINNVSRLEK